MKRYIPVLTMLLLLVSFIMCGCMDSEEKELKVLRLAETYGKDHITTNADYEFAKLVEEKSDGTIKIEVYTDGQLGKEEDVLKQVYDGELDFARVSLAVSGKGSDVLEKSELPFLFKNKGHMWRALEQVLVPKLDLELSMKNGKILSYMDAGARNLYTSKPIEKAEDFKGLTIRTDTFSNYSSDYFFAFGARNAKLNSEDEVSKALQNKTIDGAENTIFNYYYSGQYKYAPNLLKIEYRYVPDTLIVNRAFYDKLTQKEQDILISSAAEASAHQRENFENSEKEIEQKLIAEGCKITTPSDELMKLFKEEADFVFKQIPRENVEVTLLEQIKAMK